ncbi:MAG: hypothetical protein QOH86_55 [Sphingomonadales bacterium]|nr:hypothetical protein [Sphingomonadales bacterium]
MGVLVVQYGMFLTGTGSGLLRSAISSLLPGGEGSGMRGFDVGDLAPAPAGRAE